MFNQDTAQLIIAITVIFGSIAAPTLQAKRYAHQLELERKDHAKTVKFYYEKVRNLRATNQELRMQNQMLNTALDILNKEK